MNPNSSECWQTNPVWRIDRWLEERQGRDWALAPFALGALLDTLSRRGISIPVEARQRWVAQGLLAEPGTATRLTPGVVGLVLDDDSDDAFVTPLSARNQRPWHIASNLRCLSGLPELLPRFVQALGLPLGHALPEQFGFEVSDGLGEYVDGPSMDVAGLLAVLACLKPGHELLRAACAVVQPAGGGGGKLSAVGNIPRKLAAFRRECGSQGSLLVRACDCRDTSPNEDGFEKVWSVATWHDMANEASRAGLLEPLLAEWPLGAEGMELVLGRIRWQCDQVHHYRDALDLALRAQACPKEAGVAKPVSRRIDRFVIDLHRHLGHYEQAVTLAQEQYEELSNPEAITCHDEVVQAAVLHAAALYDAHRFEEMVCVLRPRQMEIEKDSRLVTPETRAHLNNTLARAMVALGEEGWEALYRESLCILEVRDPLDRPRTLSYLIHALLRNVRTQEAGDLLEEARRQPGLNSMSRRMLAFLKADHARRLGTVWDDQLMDQPPAEGEVGHPSGFYFQATARQQKRTRSDRLWRFEQARKCFQLDAGDTDRTSVLHFLVACMQFGEAVSRGAGLESAREALGTFLSEPGVQPFFAYYARQWERASKDHYSCALEELLERVVFF
jgi:hypothetical protein